MEAYNYLPYQYIQWKNTTKNYLRENKNKIVKKLIQQRSELMRILIVVKHLKYLKPRKFQLAFNMNRIE